MLSDIALYGAIETGLICGLVAFAIYLSFRVHDSPDLTVDGSFPLGAAVAAVLIVDGWDPWLAIALALNADFLGLQAQDLNLITAVLVTQAIVLPGIRTSVVNKLTRKKA
ncbi:hypothetical protein LCGC14_0604800 [marine sediment metagenome]|uniref:Uncharacterized protein n=1 Tax=marine sediment metagenome TaxID=412755 RepID=A0A0F9R9L1_9ZZZZ